MGSGEGTKALFLKGPPKVEEGLSGLLAGAAEGIGVKKKKKKNSSLAWLPPF